MPKSTEIRQLRGAVIREALIWDDAESTLAVELHLEGGKTFTVDVKRSMTVNILEGDNLDETFIQRYDQE